MGTPAYNQLYLGRTAKALGNMLHNAVLVYGNDGETFLSRFIQSGIACEIENENPKYTAGMSGAELYLEVIDKTSGNASSAIDSEAFERSDVYWVGWILAHYQGYSGRRFDAILDTVSYSDLLALYNTLHEADIQKAFDVLDSHFVSTESRLKYMRMLCRMTQQELALKSDVSINTIRAYERKSKDLNKAQIHTVMKLACALKCSSDDLIEPVNEDLQDN